MKNLVARQHYEWLEGDSGDPWLVEGLISESLTLLIAKRKVGKSLLTTDLAAALVLGETEWLGRKVREGFHGNVYFIVTDSKAELETSRRLADLGVPHGTVMVARVRRGPASVDEWMDLGKNLYDAGTRVVIVDNGTGFVNDIIKAEFVNPLMDGLKELVNAGLAVVLVHHEPKAGTQAAGLYIWESEARR